MIFQHIDEPPVNLEIEIIAIDNAELEHELSMLVQQNEEITSMMVPKEIFLNTLHCATIDEAHDHLPAIAQVTTKNNNVTALSLQ